MMSSPLSELTQRLHDIFDCDVTHTNTCILVLYIPRYGEYPNLWNVNHKNITQVNQVLDVGWGDYALSADIYHSGLQNLTNIDISDDVISQMTDTNKVKRSKITFEKVDVT